MSEYSVVAQRLEWEEEGRWSAYASHPWFKEYVSRRLDPTFRMSTEAEKLCAFLYGHLAHMREVAFWTEELEATAKDRDDE